MTDRPSEHSYEGFGSFELVLATARATYSAGVCAILAAPADVQLTTEVLLEHVHSEDRDVVRRALARNRGERASLTFEVRVQGFDEVERVVRARADTVFAADGEPIRLVGTLQDVTQEQ